MKLFRQIGNRETYIVMDLQWTIQIKSTHNIYLLIEKFWREKVWFWKEEKLTLFSYRDKEREAHFFYILLAAFPSLKESEWVTEATHSEAEESSSYRATGCHQGTGRAATAAAAQTPPPGCFHWFSRSSEILWVFHLYIKCDNYNINRSVVRPSQAQFRHILQSTFFLLLTPMY